MTVIRDSLRTDDTLHVWLRPVGPRPAEVRVEIDGGQVARLGDATRPDFVMRSFIALRAGEATLIWDAEATEVSLVYVFHPALVDEEGIRVLRSTERNRDAGPHALFHFQPPFGWMNDPNGLFMRDGALHLFYQHYPHALRWNTMHWGHAVTRDFVTWTHQPVFLRPREELLGDPAKKGGAFSGTALPLPDGALRVFYTDREDDRLPEREWQMAALSQDGLAAGPSTPILTVRPPGLRNDFRDPFVLSGPDGRLKMLLASGDANGALVLLYETDAPDGASGWRFVDVLHRVDRYGPLAAECPSLVALEGEGAGLWALFVGFIGSTDPATGRRNLTLAIVGRFDGQHFESVAERILDFGTDCYAFQAFPTPEGPCGIGWAANWASVDKNRDFPSRMTMIRRLIWRNGQLLTPPAPGVERLHQPLLAPPSRGMAPLPAGCAEYALRFAKPGVPFTLHLGHPTRELGIVSDGRSVEVVDRELGQGAGPRYREEGVALSSFRLFLDHGVIEFYGDDGRWCGTRRIEGHVTALRLEVDTAGVAEETLWPLAAPA